ncbi:hypothetical protein L6164_028887 [Bauhinia variegata]|uniref:Uncharacterized protein n=1 Tax=Bauhinia variegata TaxID=167791 RepID=A0ACB9L746_BAUVA|nr:hypothetical protein L6164_028887 [Bauhinia variegata]
MVTGLELIPLVLEVGPAAFKLIKKLIPQKGTKDVESSANSILAEMKPLTEAMKRVEGTTIRRAEPAGVAGELKQLIRTVEEGSQLVRKRKNQKELEEWIDSFRASLSIAMFRVLMVMAVNVEEIKQQLLPNQSPQMHIHVHFSDEKYRMAYKEFIHCINMFRGPEPPLKGVESVSADKTKIAKPQIPSVPKTTKLVAGSQTRKAVNNPTEPALKKVVFEVLARDDYGKKIVEKAACYVNGVVYAERVVQDNQERDLVIVIATEIFVVQDMINYLQTKLKRKHVYVKEK